MIKYVKKHLSLKIFLLTTVLLIGISAVTYAFIAVMMPMTYTDSLNRELDAQARELAGKLSDSVFEKAQDEMEEFSRTNQADLLLLDEKGMAACAVYYSEYAPRTAEVFSKTLETTGDENEASYAGDSVAEESTAVEDFGIDWETGVAVASVENSDAAYRLSEEIERKAIGRFSVQFQDKNEVYTLAVIGATQKVNQAVEALEQVFPLLILTVFFVSVLVSLFYSGYLTRPVLRLSRVSRQMADLDFRVQCQETREDEIGILSQSLDELSRSLDRALRELQTANAKLQDDIEKEREQERRRMAFFAAASHELKTPVTILKGQLEGMLQGVGSYKDRDKYLNRSKEVAENMEEMVREILTISRMESEGFSIVPAQTDLAELIRIQLADLHELFEKKHMHMEIDLPEHLDCLIDGEMLKKVIRNILVNAVRYSPENARISVGLHREGASAVFRAENSGVRIPEEQLEKIFEAFYRVDTSRNRKSGGSGLGLYIVREILKLHRAGYCMENTASGVQFTFWLSLQDSIKNT